MLWDLPINRVSMKCIQKLTLWRVEEHALNKGTGTIPGKTRTYSHLCSGVWGPWQSAFLPTTSSPCLSHCHLCLLGEALGWEFSLNDSSQHVVSCLAAAPLFPSRSSAEPFRSPEALVSLTGQPAACWAGGSCISRLSCILSYFLPCPLTYSGWVVELLVTDPENWVWGQVWNSSEG